MAAVTNTTVFVNTPLAGVNVGAKSSSLTAPGVLAPLTNVLASNGHRFISVTSGGAHGSTSTVKISAAGIASTDAGSAGWTMNAPGGTTNGQIAWAMKTSL